MAGNGTCPTCHVTARTYRDATGTPEFRWCPDCSARTYRRDDGGWSSWDPNALWRIRFLARRNVDALLAAAERQIGETDARVQVFGLVAQWIARPTMGDWMAWTAPECRAILAQAAPLITRLAESFVTGDARMALHAAAVRGRSFPRLRLLLRVGRDRLQGGVGRAFTRAFGGLLRRLEGAAPVTPLDVP